MASKSKLFKFAGSSTEGALTKIRYANDVKFRSKSLATQARIPNENIVFVELPFEMIAAEAHMYLKGIGYGANAINAADITAALDKKLAADPVTDTARIAQIEDAVIATLTADTVVEDAVEEVAEVA